MKLEVSSQLVEQLIADAGSAHPRECCGILLGEVNHITAIQPAINVHATPETHFEIDPQALIDAHRASREGGPQVVGYYHSHPNGLTEPSATDRERAAQDGAIWAIVAGEEVSFWRDGEERFEALPYRILER